MQTRLVPMTLLAGIAAGVASLAVHQWWWGFALAAVTTLLVLLAAPPGWGTRLPFALGYVSVVGTGAVSRGEGDYLVASTGHGYAVLGLALAVLCLTVATLPRPGRSASDRQNPRSTGDSAPLE